MAGISNHGKGYGGYIRSGVTGSNHPFDFAGHPGKWQRVYTVNATGQTDFTGSKAGIGAIIVESATAGTITLTGGGTIPATSIAGDGLVELSIKQTSAGNALVAYCLQANVNV